MSTEKRILLICLISFVGPFLFMSINIAIPAVPASSASRRDRMSWSTIFPMTTAAFLLPWARCPTSMAGGGRIPRWWSSPWLRQRRPLPRPTGLISPGLTQGIALSGVYVSYMPLLLATTDEAHQGHILGRAVALTYLGLSLGPVIGGL